MTIGDLTVWGESVGHLLLLELKLKVEPVFHCRRADRRTLPDSSCNQLHFSLYFNLTIRMANRTRSVTETVRKGWVQGVS